MAATESPPAAREAKTDLAGLFAILWRRAASIALITTIALALAALLVALMPLKYVTSATLFIDPRPKKVLNEETPPGGYGTDLALLESQVAIIRSDAVLGQVVDKLGLDNDIEFAPPPGRGLGSLIKDLLGIKTPPQDPKSQALDALARSITVKRAQKTYVVEIEATATSPVKAARIAQAVADAYIADQSGAKSGDAQRANAFIDGRLDELRNGVRLAETKVDAFRKSNSILTSEGGTVGEQQLTRLNAELVTARSQAAEAKARLDEVTAAAQTSNPDVITDPAKTGLVFRLREQLAQVARREASLASQLLPRHPVLIDIRSQMTEIKSQIGNELKRLAAAAKSEYQIASSRERELTKALDTAKAEVARTNTAQIKLRELEGEVAASRDQLRVFLTRSKETEEQRKITTTEARLISPPSVPNRPNVIVPGLILSLGLLGGLATGVASALIRDLFDRRSPQPSNVQKSTGIETLGSIPPLSRRTMPLLKALPFNFKKAKDVVSPSVIEASALAPIALALTTPNSRAESAYRQAVTSVLARIRQDMHARDTVSTLMVASPIANPKTGETAFALAYAAAAQGNRVLLIDAASASTEISDTLAGPLPTDRAIVLDKKADLLSIISRDDKTGLAFLPIGLADLRTLNNLQRLRLQRGLKMLAEDFDLMVIHAGAVLEDQSAHAVLPVATHIVLMAPSEATNGSALQSAIDHLDLRRDKIMGVVLTSGDGPKH